MILTKRSALIRNAGVSAVNAAITLVILLIAPLGIVAVWMNTALIAIASFITATVADRIVVFLNNDPQRIQVMSAQSRPSSIQRPNDSSNY